MTRGSLNFNNTSRDNVREIIHMWNNRTNYVSHIDVTIKLQDSITFTMGYPFPVEISTRVVFYNQVTPSEWKEILSIAREIDTLPLWLLYL
jgi:hypothetical protein